MRLRVWNWFEEWNGGLAVGSPIWRVLEWVALWMLISACVRYFFEGSCATCFFRDSVAIACYRLSREEWCLHSQNRHKSWAVEEKEVQVALSFFFSYHSMNNNDDYSLFNNILCCLSQIFLGFFGFFPPFIPTFFPFLTVMIPAFVCHVCWLVYIPYLPESIWQH